LSNNLEALDQSVASSAQAQAQVQASSNSSPREAAATAEVASTTNSNCRGHTSKRRRNQPIDCTKREKAAI
jgi:hypothetical protein